jgi:hypothetical protein
MTDFMLYLLESAACLALFYFGYWLFLRKETYFCLNRFYLVFSIIASLIIPVFKVTSPFLTAKAPVNSYLYPAAVTPPKTWGVAETLLLVYAVGAVLFLTRFIFHMIKLYFVIRKHGAHKVNGLKIVSVDKDFSPFSFLNFLFINDRQINEINMRRIIAHENIHIKQYHSFDILLIELLTIFQWFNPFVWPYKKSLQETHEFLADRGVIAQGFSSAKYQLLMFEQHVGLKLFEFVNNFKQSQIKRRITMMSKIKSRGAARLKLLLVLPLAAFLMLAFAEPKPADPQVAEALGASMAGIKINNNPAVLNTGQEDEVKKQKLEEAKKELQILKEKEKDLRQQLEATKDAEKKAEIKSSLEKILVRKEIMENYLNNGQLPPPPAPPKPPAASSGESPPPPPKPANAPSPPPPPPTPEELKQQHMKQEYMMLSEKADAIRAKLDETKDDEKRSELKALLIEVSNKQEKIKADLAESEAEGLVQKPNGPTIEDLKKEYTLLSEKEAKIKEKLAQTKNKEEKTELKAMLADVQKKMEQIKAKGESLKKEGKKVN